MWIVLFAFMYLVLLVFMVWIKHTKASYGTREHILYRTQDKVSQLLSEDKVKDAETEWYAYLLYKQAIWKI